MDDSALSENLSESDEEETMTAAMVLLKIEEVRNPFIPYNIFTHSNN